MNCPTCGERPEVLKVKQSAPGITDRLLRCAEHGTFWSQEVLKRWIDPARLGLPADQQKVYPYTGEVYGRTEIGRSGVPPSPRNHNPSPTVKSSGGVGGGLPSGSGLGLVLIRSEPDLPKPKRSRRARGVARIVYPAEFEAEWSQTAKTGSKDKAYELWEQHGRPQFGAAWVRWEACPEWNRESYHYPHVRSWLYDKRYLQDPNEARIGPGGRSGSPTDLDDLVRNLAAT